MDSEVRRLTGEETLSGLEIRGEETMILDFWRWAFSDLRANDLWGVFAEWLVAILLGIVPPVRDSWAGWDLKTAEEVMIEVKTAAYVQTWIQRKPSLISFGGLSGQLWDPATSYSGAATFNADLYVFCLQIEQDRARWDVLDLHQWRFYALRRDEVARYGYRRISLGPLRKLAPELTASEFRDRAPALIRQIEVERALTGR